MRRTVLHVFQTTVLRFNTFPSVWVRTLIPREPRFPCAQSSFSTATGKAHGWRIRGDCDAHPIVDAGMGFMGCASPSIGYAR
jgi:hypothetical protein